MNAGTIITKMRQARKKTKRQLSSDIGLTRQRTGEIEAAEDMNVSTLLRAADALGFEIIARDGEIEINFK